MANVTDKKKDDKGAVQSAAETAVDKAKDVAGAVADKAKDVAGNVADTARNVAGAVGDKARSMASAAGDTADSAVSSVGCGMRSTADTIRDKGPQSGVLGSAAGAVASALDNSGRYLEEEGLSGMADDVMELVRRNPLPALLIGIGVGFLLARLTSRS